MTQQHIHRGWGRWLLVAWMGVLAACGGGGGSSSSNEVPTVSAPQAEGLNVQAVRVGPGPVGAPRVANVLYTQVRVCAPNDASNCQIIDHVLVDTGSTGLRLLKSAVTPTLRAALPGNSLYSCVQFLDGSYMWGPVVKADVSMGGDQLRHLTAGGLPIQLVINSAELPAPAGGCAGSSEDQAERSNDDVSKLGANGIPKNSISDGLKQPETITITFTIGSNQNVKEHKVFVVPDQGKFGVEWTLTHMYTNFIEKVLPFFTMAE